MKHSTFTKTLRHAVAIIGVSVLGATSAAYALEDAAQIKLGEAEYVANCAACHGIDAKGDGPVADVLSQKPTDLTQITQNYSGMFPGDFIYDVIDGQRMINPHGDRQMPVWGPRYLDAAIDRANSVPHQVNARIVAQSRIEALVAYIASLQAE